MHIVNRPGLIPRRIARYAHVIVSAAWPNLILVFPLVAIIVGLTRREVLRFQEIFAPVVPTFNYFGFEPFEYAIFGIEFNRNKWIAETALMLVVLTLLMLLLLMLFDRGSHKRRWGRKPPEIEVATRYFMG